MKTLAQLSLSLLLLGHFSSAKDASTRSSTDNDTMRSLSPYQRVSMYLGHSLFKAEPISRQSEILWGIQSVKPMLDIADNLEGHFDNARVEQKFLSVLKEKAIPIDMEKGHLLYFQIKGVWDKDKTTLLYTYDLDLVDQVYISRDGQIKSNIRSVWNVSNMGYAGKDVYQNAMLINIESAVERFAISYFEQLDFDIISDTPRLAQQTYQKILDGEMDILSLLAEYKLEE